MLYHSVLCNIVVFYVLCWSTLIKGISAVTTQSGMAPLLCFCVSGQEKPVFSQQRRDFTFQLKFVLRVGALSPLFLRGLPALVPPKVPAAFCVCGQEKPVLHQLLLS